MRYEASLSSQYSTQSRWFGPPAPPVFLFFFFLAGPPFPALALLVSVLHQSVVCTLARGMVSTPHPSISVSLSSPPGSTLIPLSLNSVKGVILTPSGTGGYGGNRIRYSVPLLVLIALTGSGGAGLVDVTVIGIVVIIVGSTVVVSVAMINPTLWAGKETRTIALLFRVMRLAEAGMTERRIVATCKDKFNIPIFIYILDFGDCRIPRRRPLQVISNSTMLAKVCY